MKTIIICLLCIQIGLTIVGIIAQLKKDKIFNEISSLLKDNKSDN